ncbi:hypothetical protein B0H14DRAFT_3712540 [Mycena olivaceomarginata]|nr:hypothetical protein B0H14DRAFT_3712540 [Mycena olivaceomarginata]
MFSRALSTSSSSRGLSTSSSMARLSLAAASLCLSTSTSAILFPSLEFSQHTPPSPVLLALCLALLRIRELHRLRTLRSRRLLARCPPLDRARRHSTRAVWVHLCLRRVRRLNLAACVAKGPLPCLWDHRDPVICPRNVAATSALGPGPPPPRLRCMVFHVGAPHFLGTVLPSSSCS